MEYKKQSKKRKAIELIKIVSENIKKYRSRLKISQEQLEYKTNLAIPRYESGKYDMTLTSIHIISKHLQIEAWQLLKQQNK